MLKLENWEREKEECVDEGTRNGKFQDDGSSEIDVNDWSVR